MPFNIGAEQVNSGANPLQSFIQNEYLKRQYAAQNPGFGALLGQGLGQGISRGVDLGVQNYFDEKRQDRIDSRQAKRDEAIAKRYEAQAIAQQERAMALLQERALQEQEAQASQGIQSYLQENPSPDPLFRIEYEDIINEHAALQYDPNTPRLPQEQLVQRQQQLRDRTINLARKIPRPLPPEQRFLQNTVGGDALNQSVASQMGAMGQDVNVGQPQMFDNTARYQWIQRAGGGKWELVDGTGAEYQAKVQAQMVKANPPQPPPLVPIDQSQYAGLAQHYPPGTTVWADPKTGKPDFIVPPKSATAPTEKDWVTEASKVLGSDATADEVLSLADKLKDREARVGERKNEVDGVRELMKSEPQNADFYNFINRQVLDMANSSGLPAEVILQKEIDALKSMPPSQRTPQMAQRGMALEKLKMIYDAN